MTSLLEVIPENTGVSSIKPDPDPDPDPGDGDRWDGEAPSYFHPYLINVLDNVYIWVASTIYKVVVTQREIYTLTVHA